MKNTLKTSLIFLGLLLASLAGFAQTQLTVTTLSAAITSGKQSLVTLTAITGLTAGNSYIVVDQEAMPVSSIPSTGTTIGVIRQGFPTYHNNSAAVTLVTSAAVPYALVSVNPRGACARGASTTVKSTLYLPIINTSTGEYSDCLGGVFVTGVPAPVASITPVFLNASPGDTVYTSVDSNGVALAATTDLYCSSLDLPTPRWLTGIKVMNGTSVSTDHHIYSLYDVSGNLLAASASTTSFGSASEYGGAAFSQLFPAEATRYFTCVQPVTAAGTASVRMMLTQQNDWTIGGIITITAGS